MADILATAQRVSDRRFALSESPVWDADTKSWLFVDINARTAHEYISSSRQIADLATVEGDAWKHLCAVIPRKEDGFVAIGTNGIAVMSSNGAIKHETYVELQSDPRVRFNDVQCINGRLFGGTIDCEKFSQPIAAFGEITPTGFKVIDDEHVISNGLAISPDGKFLYHVESTVPFVCKFDRNPETGELSNYRPAFGIIDGINFFKQRDDHGAPLALGDGMAAAMYNGKFVLCVAEWGLSRIGIYDPVAKQMVGQIAVPVTRPTSIAFGGENFGTAFITSERLPHDAEDNCGVFTAEVPGLTGFAPTMVDWP